MSQQQVKSTLDGLPKPFVQSLKTLFDILDPENTGYIKCSDIESRWEEGGVQGLPGGVLDALKKVKPQSGMLSFERFIAGVKIALIRSRNDVNSKSPVKRENGVRNRRESSGRNFQNMDDFYNHVQAKSGRSKSTSSESRLINSNPNVYSHKMGPATAAVRPNNANAPARTASMPQLRDFDYQNGEQMPLMMQQSSPRTHDAIPDAQTLLMTQNIADIPQAQKNSIVNSLKNWHKQQMSTERTDISSMPPTHSNNEEKHLSGKEFPTEYRERKGIRPLFVSQEEPVQSSLTAGRRAARKKEPRRHTLANGVDFNMIKRMKQLEQEKDILMQGLEVLEQARQWYLNQITAVQEKQKYIAQSTSHLDYSIEAHQERMNFESARITEVNQQLRALVDSSEKGFPLHMNLALSRPKEKFQKKAEDLDNMHRIKAQNRQLTEEVGQKGERITKLEKEKVTLIKELFEAKSKLRNNHYDDTTFM